MSVKHDIDRGFSAIRFFGTLALIGFALWFIWSSAIQPHTKWRVASTVQKAAKIENITYNYPEKKSLIDWKIWVVQVKIW